MRSLRVLLLLFAATAGGTATVACGRLAASSVAGGGGQLAGGSAAGGSGAGESDASIDIGPQGGGGGRLDYAALCGEGLCVPGGNQLACGAGPGGDAGADGGPVPPSIDCKLVRSGDGATGECLANGGGQESDPCTNAVDCAAGLACVETAAGGVCRAYCCADPEADCPDKGSFCSPEPMFEASAPAAAEVLVPVCKPADGCQLLQPDQPGGCSEGLMCSVVKSDGTTTCVPEGEGLAGESCPCADGHVCSQLTGTCLKLCKTNEDDALYCDAGGTCQGGSMGLPDGIGVCS
jgi:hypothetical protein